MKLFKYTNPDKLWFVTTKIDGVNATKKGDVWLSRANKPLYNLPLDCADGIYEVFLGDFKTTISAVKTRKGKLISKHLIFSLDPYDHRLTIGEYKESDLDKLFKKSLLDGGEGLVVIDYNSLTSYKMKDKVTYDVTVTDIIEGTGKFKGMLGAFKVVLDGVSFKVGTGLTNNERSLFYTKLMIGNIIEVEGMSLLPSGRLRHPRFVRYREDLSAT